MTDDALSRALPRALLALRITLGLFLLQWGVEKFVVPENTVGIWGHFYGIDVAPALGYLFGAVEIAIAVCLFLGRFLTVAAGAGLALHAVTVLVSWRQLIDPWGDPVNHLFVAEHSGARRLHRPVPAAALGSLPSPIGAPVNLTGTRDPPEPLIRNYDGIRRVTEDLLAALMPNDWPARLAVLLGAPLEVAVERHDVTVPGAR